MSSDPDKGLKRTFGGIEPVFAQEDTSRIYLQSIAYDGTSTWGKGADKGFELFLEACENMELYDIETDSEVFRQGVFILPPLKDFLSAEAMYETVLLRTRELLGTGKFLTFFGGEHSVSIGLIQAYTEKYNHLTVLQIDAHADLRPEYLGTPYNHACAVYQASKTTNLIQVGIRSMDIVEKEHMNVDKVYFAQDIEGKTEWMQESIDKMTKDVYVTVDLDALDPSIMPATGTPEPGGLLWYTLITYLRMVFSQKNVVGFDIVEFAPIEALHAPQFLVAKLYYKMLNYKFQLPSGQ
ncbi:MAG TPA: agmatinase [Saprospirales bacterium]|nr:agmatinase [Saprospirales bacterium]HAY70749.1 agmatinase [Saprospirales bacterium]HRQ28597.1 agmatinase [Saprospiraceae bacterium]